MTSHLLERKFPLGQTVITPNALERLTQRDVLGALKRHAAGEKFWIITEADRSATTVLMPEDY
jgi:hypothetical protein